MFNVEFRGRLKEDSNVLCLPAPLCTIASECKKLKRRRPQSHQHTFSALEGTSIVAMEVDLKGLEAKWSHDCLVFQCQRKRKAFRDLRRRFPIGQVK